MSLPPFRVERISITNYKAIDALELELPPPLGVGELDVHVLGSKNGVGKTSVLECCAFGIIGAFYRDFLFLGINNPRSLFESVVKAGLDHSKIEISARFDQKTFISKVKLAIKGFDFSIPEEIRLKFREDFINHRLFMSQNMYNLILGHQGEPLVANPVIFLNSYRKILEGTSSLGVVIDHKNYFNRDYVGDSDQKFNLSYFKLLLIQAIMSKSGVFENFEHNHDEVLTKVNEIMGTFAASKLDKLRSNSDGTIELRVSPLNGGPSFSFDGLSSGQKEVIATLFLIWYATREQPSLVLIDEPELHLNAEWQRIFVHQLKRLAPWNQYILATHSEEIFASVPAERRLLLEV